MATNFAANFAADTGKFIAKKTLAVAKYDIIVSQFADKIDLAPGNGTTYNVFRYERVSLPATTLSEGVPSAGQSMQITQVTGTVAQWGDLIRFTDVAESTVYHSLVEKAAERLRTQIVETVERNTFNALMGGTQVNYVGAVGARSALLNTSVMNPLEIGRAVAYMRSSGAQMFGSNGRDNNITRPNTSPMGASTPSRPYLIAVIHPNVEQDLRQNAQMVTAWSYSDIFKLYNSVVGQWGQVLFTSSNLVPTYTGAAAVTGTAGTAGALATGSYYIRVTASSTYSQYESVVYQNSGAIAVTGPNGSISVTVPSTPGYTYNVYIGTSTSQTNLGTSAAGPSTGPLAGQATQLSPGTVAVITGIGIAQVPPAAPATGVTVYPSFFFGMNAYANITLDALKVNMLKDADKSDPQNQTRVFAWKLFYGTMIVNNPFMMRVESGSAFNSTLG